MKSPNTFIIGAPKAGTTALATYLSQHPNAFLCYPKEPSYWSTDLKQKNANLKINTIADYESLFSGADETTHNAVIDASTRYIMSEAAILNIVEYQPNAKFIIMLRDLVEIAYAFHMEQLFNDNEDIKDFYTAWIRQDERISSGVYPKNCADPKLLHYRNVVSLGTQLASVLNYVPRNQVLIIFQDDMHKNTKETYLNVTRFLGLEDYLLDEFPRHGTAHFNRFDALAKLYQSPNSFLQPIVRGLKKFVRTKLSYNFQELIKALFIKRVGRTKLEPGVRKSIIAELTDEIDLVSEITGRNLNHWKE